MPLIRKITLSQAVMYSRLPGLGDLHENVIYELKYPVAANTYYREEWEYITFAGWAAEGNVREANKQLGIHIRDIVQDYHLFKETPLSFGYYFILNNINIGIGIREANEFDNVRRRFALDPQHLWNQLIFNWEFDGTITVTLLNGKIASLPARFRHAIVFKGFDVPGFQSFLKELQNPGQPSWSGLLPIQDAMNAIHKPTYVGSLLKADQKFVNNYKNITRKKKYEL